MQATYQPQALKPALIESPSAAITVGTGSAAAVTAVPGTHTTEAARTNAIFLTMATSTWDDRSRGRDREPKVEIGDDPSYYLRARRCYR
ncbi:hypothetical protein GCM10022226_81130 [Sphaerisporangium flaviroseum]|uniref:Uncharacterized protein n=1 Tax=Sphaerisporangium flaviroseum TaxID=509199 RepID=A0ABP7JI38_9ACTN